MIHCFDLIGCCLDIRVDSIPVCLMELEILPSGFFDDVWHCVKICDYDGVVQNSKDASRVFFRRVGFVVNTRSRMAESLVG